MSKDYNKAYNKAFISAFEGNVGTVDFIRLVEFMKAYDADPNGNALYKEFSDCYTSIIDAMCMFDAGIKFKEALDTPTE